MKRAVLTVPFVYTAFASAQAPIPLLYPQCITMEVIHKQVCPVHHGGITSFEVISYDSDGISTRIYSRTEWRKESALLLKLTALTLEQERIARAVEKAKEDVARAHEEANHPLPTQEVSPKY